MDDESSKRTRKKKGSNKGGSKGKTQNFVKRNIEVSYPRRKKPSSVQHLLIICYKMTVMFLARCRCWQCDSYDGSGEETLRRASFR